MQFLWGNPAARPTPESFQPKSTRWWRQYSGALSGSDESLAELYQSSCDIVSLLPDPAGSAGTAAFRGLVVGAVQSGKTRSMIGVSAVALDQGFRIIVVLAGGKDDLRRQTARRFNTQLLRQRDKIPEAGDAFTLSIAATNQRCGGIALPFSTDIHQWGSAILKMRRALENGEPCVLVIKKLPASLAAMRGHLDRLYGEFGGADLPMLVLDDECDDASVDRAGMPIPEAIANLWHGHGKGTIAYVGYTATAAANLLQQSDNALYPNDFVYLLRYPASKTSRLTYQETNPESWYSGSACFYSEFGVNPSPSENYLIESTVSDGDLALAVRDNPSLKDAMRAYIVAGAYRLALEGKPGSSAAGNYPLPHSMLVQTSPAVDEHVRWLVGVVEMFDGSINSDGTGSLSVAKVLSEVDGEEESWGRWYNRFSESLERVYNERPSTAPSKYVSWSLVRSNIAEVAENIRIKAINSDPELGQNLDFEPRQMADGSVMRPQDIYVIAIGGARLSRGLTVEGLSISYFTRWSASPTEDTVQQISRWFGYRGRYLAFCRLFTSAEIYEQLQEIHENDMDLRLQLAELMARKKSPKEAGLVLKCNPRSLPTAKIGSGKVCDLRFSPFQGVFRYLETSEFAAHNEQVALELIAKIRSSGAEEVRNESGRVRGFLVRNWTANDAATILDSLAYTLHNPPLEDNPARDFYRKTDLSRDACQYLRIEEDPYQVAAYLRQWSAEWRQLDCNSPPGFSIGVTFGDETNNAEPFDIPLLNREVTPDSRLIGQWTGRSENWRGDALFDGPDNRFLFADSVLRSEGLDGLLLLHVVHKDAQGRFARGNTRPHHSVTFGVSIPDGGPAFRRVTINPSRVN
ncbi:Z1 domain-containing protein [Burkholderia gladioli]|uniref:Z1 domain-containing protein n=1 Tax=Burkholderia gladioli TaxID=28095 RepID=UPI00163E66AE|nr:Z1 domain-containing protein [Burkholderia gladioli]